MPTKAIRGLWPVMGLILFTIQGMGGELPVTESFEGLSAGPLHGQSAWQGVPSGKVHVQSEIVYAGSKAGVAATNAIMARDVSDPAAKNVWIDFYANAQYRAFTRQPSLSGDATTGFYINQSGHIVARSNDTWVTLTSVTIATNVWYRFTVNLDYNSSAWAIHVADSTANALSTPVATNLAFDANATNAVFKSFRVKN